MRLKKLTVSGFKSFVDPTDIRLPANLVGIVGPNGCGKSNVIDAIRWVMGEISAKVMRSDQMADVIFNGSRSRKPVGQASVELIFDNQAGLAGGSFAKFSEISVKRTLSRDGESNYYLNNTKSRRKDVLDLFRGTGLGARSYSIIEQGMISQVVVARPDELRAFVEEAAGTSRYKDRRRETESRIRHTRENLERMQDIRDELEKHLRRLQRQSAAARRYKALREEERKIHAQLQVMQLQRLNVELEEQNQLTGQCQNALDAAIQQQKQTEVELEQLRHRQAERLEHSQQAQQRYQNLLSDIRTVEQRIEHLRETRQRQAEEVNRLRQLHDERRQEQESRRHRQAELDDQIERILPELKELRGRMEEAECQHQQDEETLLSWQQSWEKFNEMAMHPSHQQEAEKSRIDQLEQHLEQTTQRRERLLVEQQRLQGEGTSDDIRKLQEQVRQHDEILEATELAFHQREQYLQEIRDRLAAQREEWSDRRIRQQEVASRMHSLHEIQTAALAGENEELHQWLAQRFGENTGKLARIIRVKEGWQIAVDRILHGFLGAICISAKTLPDLSNRPEGAASILWQQLVDVPPDRTLGLGERLIDQVEAEGVNLLSLLADIFVADNLDQALAMQAHLSGRDCVVTKDGIVMGANWISFADRSQLETGVLAREEEIHRLQKRLTALDGEISRDEAQIGKLEDTRQETETALQEQRTALNQLRAEKTSLHNRLGREESRVLEVGQRMEQMALNLGELESQIQQDHEQINEARERLAQVGGELGKLDVRREELLSRRDILQQQVAQSRDHVESVRDQLHREQLEKQRLDSSREALVDQLRRLERQVQEDTQRLEELSTENMMGDAPEQSLHVQLQSLQQHRAEAEQQSWRAQEEVGQIGQQLSGMESRRKEQERSIANEREVLDRQRLQRQEFLIRRDTQAEEVAKLDQELDSLMMDLPETANLSAWKKDLEEIRQKIERVGPVNLVAIEEYEEENQRKEYLDRQHSDLTESLDTLEKVIRKIDKETRSRFRETFDRLNAGFQDFFPQLFGGGQAELRLTSDDMLVTGVTVMARPPGKRNTTIQPLSGGEKALTAVALLFALFQLNPAPFCMMDEVDAPLDDANVERYCNTLRKLCEVSQILVITHNKITMQMADILVGVTMVEPGISRLVTVDLEQAIELAG